MSSKRKRSIGDIATSNKKLEEGKDALNGHDHLRDRSELGEDADPRQHRIEGEVENHVDCESQPLNVIERGEDLEVGAKDSEYSIGHSVISSSSLYLETIDRKRLDFDFEKLCSVSLSGSNVYACLTCGKYFQGRGKKSYAYLHSVDFDHHVFINLSTKRIYALPEGYEVTNNSLNDIKYVLDPSYNRKYVMSIDKVPRESFDLDHRSYRPGFVGLNNIKKNSYANVVVQAIAHIPPLRNFFMLEDFSSNKNCCSELVRRFATLVKKLWNPRAFQAHVSPHELLQYVANTSNKKFTTTKGNDPFDFFMYLINELHIALGGTRKPQSSIIHKVIQGKIRIESQALTSRQGQDLRREFHASTEIETKITPFMFLSLELPISPLFQNNSEKNSIPQIPLSSLLKKYDGVTTHELPGHRRRYKIIKLPRILLIYIKRLNRSSLVDRHNPTVVNFSAENLDLSPYVEGATQPIYYNLIANIIYEEGTANDVGDTAKERWKIQLLDKSRSEWKELEDLVVESVPKELVFLRESYIQVWEAAIFA